MIWFQIYAEEIEPLLLKGNEFVARVPSFQSIDSTLYGIRNKAQGNQNEPIHSDDIVLSENLVNMTDGTFLLADIKEPKNDRILIFSSTSGRECLASYKNFFVDGTFKSCSRQFAQLYTMHVDLGSSNEETNVVPILYALLPNKKKGTYVRMLQTIVKEVPLWKPESMNIDYELAAITAIQEVFPNIKIQGCFFHFGQCLWRKVQEIGLSEAYKNNDEVRHSVRMCGALPFLKLEDIDDGWVHIHSNSPVNDKLEEFFDYFIEQWLENPHLPREIWNCYKRRHRTNNAVEGWNYRLNNNAGRPHPHIRDLILILKEEAQKADGKIRQLELNLEGTKRRKKYRKMDDRIWRSTTRYENDRNVGKFLNVLSYVLKLE